MMNEKNLWKFWRWIRRYTLATMTIEERLAHLHEKTEPIIKKYGIQMSNLTPVKPRKRERVTMTVYN